VEERNWHRKNPGEKRMGTGPWEDERSLNGGVLGLKYEDWDGLVWNP